MLILVAAIFVIVSSALAARYYISRTQVAEKNIDEIIARRLAVSPMRMQLEQLKEENTILRNLVLDMVENETSVAGVDNEADKHRALKARSLRRREIFGEAIFMLRRSGVVEPSRDARPSHQKQHR